MDKEFILGEIKRTAAENGGKPLGTGMLAKKTGIKRYDWNLHWDRLSDAHREAGLEPNTFNHKWPEAALIENALEEPVLSLV